MDSMLLNIVVIVVIIGLLIWMQVKKVSFTKRLLTGLALGILLGVLLQFI
ncbi:L-cystine uptake protein TcyP (sodium:dicarboxylate symporter family) [Virgibacillus natechei]|uniref:L-cystine uptake protein TcyP (Sodium:dicarboxylate symporter family) n=1 Tax=Virgibacillus natechei TaxID=1216297 RepID=A0ABS4IH94_9BACI|nr:hypothetical protein [Virgibacillus natechei]MBP1969806.1 L-cystine uptake protein TcyP (sodium:dicarboxylate symporter family) [Virgibacillus natechei]UZD12660.1 hypothetical protein OLD84_17450 [Virgibacillus natechei]